MPNEVSVDDSPSYLSFDDLSLGDVVEVVGGPDHGTVYMCTGSRGSTKRQLVNLENGRFTTKNMFDDKRDFVLRDKVTIKQKK